ncbi:MAG: TonB-dependent receptor [Proteobacteria bacterium]|nr:TonB-dependent receptor [Pseudomonadota bacterium]
MNNSPYQRLTVGAAVAAIMAGVAMTSYTPVARAADADEDLVEVVVTGSRILRRDTESNSPLVTVDAAQLENKSGLNIESYLNQLPAYNPAATPETSNGDVQISSVNSVGIASISLRGFGANRSLVLVDGRRAVPTNALMVVDLNSIPSSMLRSVEIISGGASATYGADAMGGVSNMLLRRDFNGLETDLQWGITEVGDNEELRASVIAGTPIAEGRGNLVFAAEYYDRKASYDKNRRFYTDSYADPTVGGNFIGFVMGANGYASSTTRFGSPNLAAVRVVAGAPNTAAGNVCGFSTVVNGPNCANAGFRFNPDGSVFLPGNTPWNLQTFDRALDDFRYSRQTVYSGGYCNSSNVALCPTGPTLGQIVKYNETEGYTSSPQSRYSFMGSAKYDITDSLQLMSSARFAQSNTETFLAGTNASGGWGVTVPYNPTTDSPILPTLDYTNYAVMQAALANPNDPAYRNPNFIPHGTAGAQHPVPVSMAILLNSRPAIASQPGVFCLYNQPGCTGGAATRDINLVGQARSGAAAPWLMETYPLDSFGRRATNNINEAWQVEVGLTQKLPIKDWTGEVYFSHGESSTYNVAFGNNSLARWRGMVTAPDYGRNALLQSNRTNNPSPDNGGFGSVAVPCTSGYYENIFNGDATPSRDCQYAVEAPLQTRTQNQQDIFELNFQGGLFDLPGGEVRSALGYQQRRNASQFNPDILQSTAVFNDQVIGVYPNGSLSKQEVVKDLWAELLIPVVKDLPFLKRVELELGGRHSSYKNTDSTNTYKINGNIQVNDWLRFRGGYNKATRAPNLGELYLPLQQIFGAGGTYGDACSLASNAPYGAGGALANDPFNGNPLTRAVGQTQAGAQSAYLICRAMMGAAVSQFYDNPTGPQAAGGGGGFAWLNQTGNPNLKSEKADTYTAGIVLRSPWQSPLTRFTFTADWYKISIKDAILPYAPSYAAFRCFGAVTVTSAAEAAAQAATEACQNVPRNQSTGGAISTLLSYDNQAWVKTRGIDFTFNWSADLADMGLASIPGALSLGFNGTWLDSYKTKTSPATYDPVTEWKGTLGPTLTSFNAGAYDYRLFTSLGYNLASFGVNLRWRHLPEVEGAGNATIRAAQKATAIYNATGKGQPLGWTPTTAYNTPQYDQFDLSAFWNVNDTVSVRFGIDNVFDTQPSITGKNAGRPYNSSLTPAQNTAALAAVCSAEMVTAGCVRPTAYSLATTGLGSTNTGFYDINGRRYFVAVKARF